MIIYIFGASPKKLWEYYYNITQYIIVYTRINCQRYRQGKHFETFRERVRVCVRESVNKVFNPPSMDDPHYITFSPYESELHDPMKREIYEPKVSIQSLFICII